MSHWSSRLPVCFPTWGTLVQIPRGVLMWNQDSPVSVVSVHCWPDVIRSLALLPCSGCFTRLRTDNVKSQRLRRTSVSASLGFALTMCEPIWSHTALLSRFHASCRSPFLLHNWQSGCWGGAPWRACNLISFSQCLTGPVDYLFASCYVRPGFKSSGGYLCETGILLIALSRNKL
jgi:hypothetical protein